jgi:TonB-linked SusC/RagA family outer membrane protein
MHLIACRNPLTQEGVGKFLLIMKLTAVFLLATFLSASANGHAQNISLNEKNASLEKVFAEIEKQSGYTFIATKELLQTAKPITIAISDASVEKVLDLCFKEQPLSYTIISRLIVVKKRDPKLVALLDPVQKKIPVQRPITGQVTNAEGQPVAGASVVVKGTNQGTKTDDKGAFTINVPEGQAVLVISSVGFETQEVDVSGKTEVNITLAAAVGQLNDIVVIGYGTQRRKDLTGSVSSINAKEVKSQPVNSFNQALQGRVSGVQITQASNAPGGGITIRVRGGNSISGSNDPLYVVDGYPLSIPASPTGAASGGAPYANPLSTINPNDIESIEVLKDASATAIYGSRGANGVVIVTTRRGKAGQTAVDYETYVGVQKVTKMLELGNAMDHLNLKNEQLANLGFAIRYGNPTGPYPKPIAEYGEGTDWQREIFRTAGMHNHQLSITGGTAKARYLVSANYFDQNGIVITNNFKRYAARFNLDAQLSDRIKIGSNFTVSRTINNGVNETGYTSSPIGGALTASPASPVYDASGNWQLLNVGPGSGFTAIANPVAVLKTSTNTLNSDRVLGNVFGQVDIIPGLVARVSFGADVLNARRNVFYTPQTLIGSDRNGYGSVGTSNNINLLNENTVTYSKQINPNNAFDLLGGVTFQTNQESRTYQEAESFPNYSLGANNLGVGDKMIANRSNLEKWALVSYLARANHRFKDRYLFTATARTDGSSRFGKNNKYGFFPSGAFAWRVSEENFLKQSKLINDLKLRVSYGITGNDGIGLYNSLSRYLSGRTVFNDVEVLTNQIERIENPDLKWEKTAQFDVGVDLGLFNNRLNITADYYIKKTSDLLLSVELPVTTGSTTVLRNVGTVENRGVEFSFNSVNIQRGGKGFNWTTSGNISFNRNKVTALANGVDHFFSGQTIIQVGEPVGSFYGNVFDGIWQTKEEIAAAGKLAITGALPGAYRFKDVNGDGVYNESDDREIIGSGLPKLIFGLTNTLTFKGFDLSVFLQGVEGNKIYNITRTFLETSDPGSNSLKINVTDHWTPTNPSNVRASIRQWRLPAMLDYYIEDGSFLRIKNINLGYQLPVSGKVIKKVRVYASVQNLVTFTSYRGYDPEVNASGNSNTVYGLDNFNYPPARSFILGSTVSF